MKELIEKINAEIEKKVTRQPEHVHAKRLSS